MTREELLARLYLTPNVRCCELPQNFPGPRFVFKGRFVMYVAEENCVVYESGQHRVNVPFDDANEILTLAIAAYMRARKEPRRDP